jgi:hypothetical protein
VTSSGLRVARIRARWDGLREAIRKADGARLPRRFPPSLVELPPSPSELRRNKLADKPRLAMANLQPLIRFTSSLLPWCHHPACCDLYFGPSLDSPDEQPCWSCRPASLDFSR